MFRRISTPNLRLLPLLCAALAAPSLASSLQAQVEAPQLPADGIQQIFSEENLTDLSLQHHSLIAAPLASDGVATTPHFTRELLQMQWRKGDPIDVYIIRPIGVARPPVTIYLYGYPVDANRFQNDAFCNLAVRNGEAAIGFVPALTGQRYHSVGFRTWFVSELQTSIVKTVHDVQMILDYIGVQPDLDASRVGIFGQGAGATIAGLSATVDPRLKAVDLLDPWGDWPAWMAASSLIPKEERSDLNTPANLQALKPYDPVTWLPSLAGRKLKLDDADFESGTPLEAKRHIEAALPRSAMLVRYPTSEDFQKNAIADGKLLDWIQQQLVMTPNPGSASAHVAGDTTLEQSKTFMQAAGDSLAAHSPAPAGADSETPNRN